MLENSHHMHLTKKFAPMDLYVLIVSV